MWFDTDDRHSDVVAPDFDLVCPSCSARCVGKTYARGVNGTYLNPYVGFCVNRIVCRSCGTVRDLPKDAVALEHRLWFRIQVGKHVLWAENELRLRAIRAVLAGESRSNHSGLYALPEWLIQRKTAEVAVRKIDRVLSNPDERLVADE